MENLLKPPSYCPDALATDIGWINPKNGEILILVKNLRAKLADAAKNTAEVLTPAPKSVTITDEPTVKEQTPVVETKTADVPVKRGRGRPRKS